MSLPDIAESTIFLSDLMSAEHKGTKHPKEKKKSLEDKKGGVAVCTLWSTQCSLTFYDISETLDHKCSSVCIIHYVFGGK